MLIWITNYGALIISLVTLIGIFINAYHVKQVHVNVNSRMDELLKLTATASRAEGVKESDDASDAKTAIAQATASTAAAAAVASEIVSAGLARKVDIAPEETVIAVKATPLPQKGKT